jgi:hypothetical protein
MSNDTRIGVDVAKAVFELAIFGGRSECLERRSLISSGRHWHRFLRTSRRLWLDEWTQRVRSARAVPRLPVVRSLC